MKALSDSDRREIREEVGREFPEDQMMQEIHFVRRLHQTQTGTSHSLIRSRSTGVPWNRARRRRSPAIATWIVTELDVEASPVRREGYVGGKEHRLGRRFSRWGG